MAKIHEEIIIIKVSKLVKDGNSPVEPVITPEIANGLDAVVQEMVGDAIIVEIIKE